MPATLGRSNSAERELKIMAEGPRLETIVSKVNLNVLKERFDTSDIFPKVKVELVRAQDRKNPDRIGLAQSVAQKMATTLARTYKGDRLRSKLVLRVNITVASDGGGSSLGIFFKKGAGRAKLSVSYCLYRRESGRVALAKQLFRSQETRESESSKRILLGLEDALRNDLSKEVTSACSSRLPQWDQISWQMIGTGNYEKNAFREVASY